MTHFHQPWLSLIYKNMSDSRRPDLEQIRRQERIIQYGCIFISLGYPLLFLGDFISTGSIDLTDWGNNLYLFFAILAWYFAIKISNTQICRHCQKRFNREATVCIHCKKDQNPERIQARPKAGWEHFIPLDKMRVRAITLPQDKKSVQSTIWSKAFSTKTQSDVTEIQHLASGELEINLARSGAIDDLITQSKRKLIEEYLFQMVFPEGVYFLKVQLCDTFFGHYTLRSLGEIYRVERRKMPRVTIPGKPQPDIQFQGSKKSPTETSSPAITGQIFDLSVGGVGIYLRSEQVKKVQAGDQIKNAQFVLDARTIRFDGEIRHIRRMSRPINGYMNKVGIQFKKIDQQDKTFLKNYIDLRLGQSNLVREAVAS